MIDTELFKQIKGKKIQIIVAHHDDECLYFGGLLSELKDLSMIKITVMTAPAPNRPDTETRMDSFRNVCWILGCTYSMYDVLDFAPIPANTREVVYRQYDRTCQIIKNDIFGFQPNIVMTHNLKGEPNPGYVNGHPMHSLVSDAVHEAVYKAPIELYTDIIGSDIYDYEIGYNTKHKKILLDCYAPAWKPDNYPFAYEKEKIIKVYQ